MLRLAGLFLGLTLFFTSGSPQGAVNPESLYQKMRGFYKRAVSHYEQAMKEREDAQDPAMSLLKLEALEILCLTGEVERCLDESKELSRKPRAYQMPWAAGLEPSRMKNARAFIRELQTNSSSGGKDRSVASECLGLLDQGAADELRKRLSKMLTPKFNQAMRRANSGNRKSRMKALMLSGELAHQMLDQKKMADVALKLSDEVRAATDSGMSLAGIEQTLQKVLDWGMDAMLVQGLERKAIQVAESQPSEDIKVLTSMEIGFELAPEATNFRSNVKKAQMEFILASLRTSRSSRASRLFQFMAAYSAVIANDPRQNQFWTQLRKSIKPDDPYLAARVLGFLGRDALISGDYFHAGSLFAEAAKKLETQENVASLRGMLLANCARALFYLGRYEKSAEGYGLAAKSLSANPTMAAKALLGQANALSFAGENQKAIQVLRQSKEIIDRISPPDQEELSLALQLDTALCAAREGSTKTALEAFLEVISEAQRRGNERALAVAYTNLSECFNDSGDPQRALEAAQSALERLNPRGQQDVYWQALTEKARAQAASGQQAEALKTYRLAMEQVEKLRSMIAAEESRLTFSEGKSRLYQGMVRSLLSLGRGKDAFQISERARSRAFLDMLGERKIRLGKKKLQARLEPVRNRMLRSLGPVRFDFDEPGLSGIERKGVETSAGWSRPKVNPSQGWLSLVTVNPAEVRDVQKVLRAGEAMVSFFHDGTKLNSFAITKRSLIISSVEVSEKELTNDTNSFLRALRKPQRGEEGVRQKGERIYVATLHPLMEKLSSKKLIVVPWGPLHYVPFLALWDGKKYLVDRFSEITTVPSASVLVMIRSASKKARNKLLVLGDPQTDLPKLPMAKEEARIIGRIFVGARVHTGLAASKKKFISQAPNSNLIHIASHGIFLPESPMDSYLALSGNSPKEGRLSAWEILGLDLSRTYLVVLSGCDTGRGTVERGDEVVGMARAFMHAGAATLVASLWPISDESTESFVIEFYKNIKMGAEPGAALVRAARKTKLLGEFSHPFFWAPFELIGG